jgi:predicted O-methyltransferase YrrM
MTPTQPTFEEVIKQTENMNALLGEEDKAILYNYAVLVPENGVIVDIGTCAGGSSLIMALASDPSVKITTIDPNPNDNFKRDRKEWGLEDRVTYLKQTSEDVATEWDGTPIDLLFIDGIHSYWGVKVDLEGLGKFVKKGGIIIAHDHKLYPGIEDAMEEAVKNGFIEKVEAVESYYRDDPRIIGIYVGRRI